MQLNSKLTYALLGSIITLAFVFLFKIIFLSNSLVPQTVKGTTNTLVEKCPVIIEEQQCADKSPITKTAKPDTTIQPKVEEKINHFVKECDEECAKALVEQLISPANITDDGGFSVTSDQANRIAKLLADSPGKLAQIENTLSSSRDQAERDNILYVLSRLSDDEVQQISRKLSQSQSKRDRVDALSLLDSVAQQNPEAQDEIKLIISSENDPDILLQAIKVSHSLSPDNVDSVTRSRLSNLINSSNDDKIRSQALITKTKIVPNNTDLQKDVTLALTSSSTTFKNAGLQALDNALIRQKKNTSQSGLRNNSQLKQNVEQIANDPNADPRTRIEALNLIRRHYSNR